MMITDAGKITRNRVVDISVVGRNTMGVRVFRIDPEKEHLVSVALLPEGVEHERSYQEKMDAAAEAEGEVGADVEVVDAESATEASSEVEIDVESENVESPSEAVSESDNNDE